MEPLKSWIFILRNSFENPEMTWTTAPVSLAGNPGKIAFVFMAAMSTDNPALRYSLKVNDNEVFNFTNNQDLTWTVKGSLGGELSFYQAKNLPGIEINGFMILRAEKRYLSRSFTQLPKLASWA